MERSYRVSRVMPNRGTLRRVPSEFFVFLNRIEYVTRYKCNSFHHHSVSGVNNAGTLCATRGPGAERNGVCNELEKTFFLQYQWFPMGVVFLTALYYLPYLLFKFVNQDMQDLKVLTKGKKADEVDYGKLVDKFFKGK